MIECKLTTDDEAIGKPYICFEVTKEQFELIKDKKSFQFFESDGHALFDLRSKTGGLVHKTVAFLVFE